MTSAAVGETTIWGIVAALGGLLGGVGTISAIAFAAGTLSRGRREHRMARITRFSDHLGELRAGLIEHDQAHVQLEELENRSTALSMQIQALGSGSNRPWEIPGAIGSGFLQSEKDRLTRNHVQVEEALGDARRRRGASQTALNTARQRVVSSRIGVSLSEGSAGRLDQLLRLLILPSTRAPDPDARRKQRETMTARGRTTGKAQFLLGHDYSTHEAMATVDDIFKEITATVDDLLRSLDRSVSARCKDVVREMHSRTRNASFPPPGIGDN